jgi:hypothetical protein
MDRNDPRSEVWTWLSIAFPLFAFAACIVTMLVLDARRQWRKHDDERSALQALKTIAIAESIFREGDKDGNGALDYGTLEQLGRAELIDAELATGTKDGYLFAAGPSTSTSEFLWFAVANPEVPGATGDRYFETNHSGVLFYTTTGSIALNTTDCDSPWMRNGVIPIGGR